MYSKKKYEKNEIIVLFIKHVACNTCIHSKLKMLVLYNVHCYSKLISLMRYKSV